MRTGIARVRQHQTGNEPNKTVGEDGPSVITLFLLLLLLLLLIFFRYFSVCEWVLYTVWLWWLNCGQFTYRVLCRAWCRRRCAIWPACVITAIGWWWWRWWRKKKKKKTTATGDDVIHIHTLCLSKLVVRTDGKRLPFPSISDCLDRVNRVMNRRLLFFTTPQKWAERKKKHKIFLL